MRRAPFLLVCLALALAACGAPSTPTVPPAATQTESTAVPSPTAPAATLTEAPPEDTPAVSTETAAPSATATLPASPDSFPDPAAFTWQRIAGGFSRPVDLTGDGQGRLLLTDQYGRVHVIENDSERSELFLDISARVETGGNEQGLLGLALHPSYLENGYFYVNYTDLDGNTVIARYTADPAAAVAGADSEKILLQVDQPYANHNGGGLQFGPDGYLYIGLGDGGSAGDPQDNAQNLDSLLGKLLRIDVDGGDPYAIPADNPYVSSGGRPEVWAYGLRNPWRFSFDKAGGDLYIGDVGQDLWEEIDYLPANSAGGVNFGWNYREGSNPFEGEPPEDLTVTDPIFQYPHPEGCSVSGGVVYRGQDLPEFNGIYIFGDYCTGRLWGIYRSPDGQWQNQVLFQDELTPSSFGVDDRNELYLLDHGSGALLKLTRK